jgi:hypothetical protein
MNAPAVERVLNPQTPGRRIGQRVAMLIAARKFLDSIPTTKTNQEEK